MSLLIVGCGYVGQALVKRLRSNPQTVSLPIYALTRSSDRAVQLDALGVRPIIGHWLDRESLPQPPPITQVLVSVAHRPDPTSRLNEDSDQTHVMGLQNLRDWLKRMPQDILPVRLIYLSTTGVYGQHSQGDLVTESTTPSPTRIGPRIALAAERALQTDLAECKSVVLRLAGIYGPGRIPMAPRLQAGLPLAVPRNGFLNLIHVQDIARAILWALDARQPRPMYLLSDGHPVVREDFYRHLAELCGISDPKFVEPEADDPKVRRATNKKIDSSCFWNDSGLTPEFPDYRAGLRHSLQTA